VGPGLLLALTLPGLVLLLLVLGVAESAWSRLGRRSPVTRRSRHALSAGGVDVFSAALAPGREADLEQQRVRQMRRADVEDGAPPHSTVDLDAGTAVLVVPPSAAQ
jgi:HAMP domain-containing protein